MNSDGLRTCAAARRQELQMAGISVGGISVATDWHSQEALLDAYAFAKANPGVMMRLEFCRGLVLTAEQVVAIGDAVGRYISACYEAEAAIYGDIASGVITTASQIAADPRWPPLSPGS